MDDGNDDNMALECFMMRMSRSSSFVSIYLKQKRKVNICVFFFRYKIEVILRYLLLHLILAIIIEEEKSILWFNL